MPISASLIVFGAKDIKQILKSILTFGLVALNDIGIKLYGGGSHDMEGQGLVNMFLFIGLIPTFTILLIAFLRDKQETVSNKVIAIFLFPTLICIYIYFFSNLV